MVALYIDPDAFDFYIEAMPEHDPAVLGRVVALTERWGLEAIPEEETPAEVTESGAVRIYMVPKWPVDDGEDYVRRVAAAA